MALGVALHAPAWACDEAEYQRLSGEQTRLAERNVWSGVERSYQSLLKTRCELRPEQHVLAAEAARMLGKALERTERLALAYESGADPDVQRQLDAVTESFGRVVITGDPRRPPELRRETMPFAPDQQRAIAWARDVLAETGAFDGLLPTGEYTVSDVSFVVEARAEAVRVVLPRRGSSPQGEASRRLRYRGPVVHLGPTWLGSPETDRVTTLADGEHQFSPASVSLFGATVAGGIELGLGYREPAIAVAAGLGYAGGYGLDTMHAVAAWSLLVVRPGAARLAVGPQYQVIVGTGTGVASWFDRGQDPTSQPREDIRFAGRAYGLGLQAWGGFCPFDVGDLQGLVELGGSWQTDGARSYLTLGLRVGLVPRVPRFDG